MKLQPSYESMSAVPTDFKNAFTEKDGKAVFNGGEFEFKTEADVSTMKQAKDNANTELTETKAKLKPFEGLDLKKIEAERDELDVLRVKVKDGSTEDEIKDLVDLKVKRKTETLTTENGTLKERIGTLEGFKVKTEKKSILDGALENVSKDVIKDARFIVGSLIERQADGTYLSNGTGDIEAGLSVEQVVAKASESRPHWKKQNTPGHGAGGGKGGVVQGKMAKLKDLAEKNSKGELTPAEQREMTTLATEIKVDRQEGN